MWCRNVRNANSPAYYVQHKKGFFDQSTTFFWRMLILFIKTVYTESKPKTSVQILQSICLP